MFKQALQMGVPIAFGTDAAVYPHGMNADVLAVPGNVLATIRSTEKPLLVMKQGQIVRRP